MNLAIVSMIREPWGGSEELWAAMASKALEEGDVVAHSTYRFNQIAPKEQALIAKGLKHIPRRGYIPPGTPVLIRMVRKAIILALNKLSNPYSSLFKTQPDLLIYIGTSYSIAADKDLLSILKKTKVPAIFHINLNQDARFISDKEAAIVLQAYRNAEHLYFVSERNLETACRHLAASLPNASVIRNPVNMEDISPVPWPENNKLQMAMVGNLLTVHKGQDLVFEVLSTPVWKERSWHLNIYGQGPDSEYLKKLALHFGLADRISFHGKVSDIPALWRENHILLMPSLMEGMPLAIVEAMLCGRPVIATDVGGHKEWITENEEGFIADAPTVCSFGSALEKAWQQKDSWEQMGRSARTKALQLYDPAAGETFYKYILEIITNTH